MKKTDQEKIQDAVEHLYLVCELKKSTVRKLADKATTLQVITPEDQAEVHRALADKGWCAEDALGELRSAVNNWTPAEFAARVATSTMQTGVDNLNAHPTTPEDEGIQLVNPPEVETIPLPTGEAHTCLLTTPHVRSMVKAMETAGMFTIQADWSEGTVMAFHPASKREVYRAIQKGEGAPWIIRHHKELFT
jgi:hypothetical protein